ncbi:hypothetical protein OOU_Y34scaffold00533g60 [Pyricularia oryzae Y34]|uniref:Uncharacterized protein n=2 Tax=Pyricularia oryzae TaxID=318829 RepID=A0AA97NYG8_PYRO3|nr:hypothetical protein OOU_Y34scaffold00533g60 [Pyricularia oryzae Y34]
MASATLSSRDMNVLEKIKDPEFDPAAVVRLEASLPADPHIKDADVYKKVVERERGIVAQMQQAEDQLEKADAQDAVEATYRKAVLSFDELIQEYPDYASARNNRAQALRRLYGDTMMLPQKEPSPQALVPKIDDTEEHSRVVNKTLADLDRAIELLSPRTPWQALSPAAANTLSLAHTQRAAIYLAASKLVAQGVPQISHGRKESSWRTLEFEAAASRDFAIGGRYGNDIAKGLATSDTRQPVKRSSLREESWLNYCSCRQYT